MLQRRRLQTSMLFRPPTVVKRCLSSRAYLNNVSSNIPVEVLRHLHWMNQKYDLKQDIYLCGHPGHLRRQLVQWFVEINGLESEYLCITRDTTENDLKQRREIYNNTIQFHNQPPVRAAIHGRILILDGIENAERNVLPALNNLLENREMSLDDGRFLTNRISTSTESSIQQCPSTPNMFVPVHPNFRVIALGNSVPPYSGRTMDPPLRSRFQCRFIDELTSESVIQLYSNYTIKSNSKTVQSLFSLYESFRNIRESSINEGGVAADCLLAMPLFSLHAIEYCLRALVFCPTISMSQIVARSIPALSWLQYTLPEKLIIALSTSYQNIFKLEKQMARSSSSDCNIVNITIPTSNNENVNRSLTFHFMNGSISNLHIAQTNQDPNDIDNFFQLFRPFVHFIPTQRQVLLDILLDFSLGQHLCVFGHKGSGKSLIARNVGAILNIPVHVFPVYKEFTSRDLLQRRVTKSTEVSPTYMSSLSDDEHTKTSWVDSPLIVAAREGHICILDGIDRVDPHSLFVLRTLIQQNYISLPNGDILTTNSVDPKNRIMPGFRIIALGIPPTQRSVNDAREKYVTSDLGFTYHYLPSAESDNMLKVAWNVVCSNSNSQSTETAATVPAELSQVVKSMAGPMDDAMPTQSLSASQDLELSFRQLLRLCRTTKQYIDKNVSYDRSSLKVLLAKCLHNMLLIRYMPEKVSALFYQRIGFSSPELQLNSDNLNLAGTPEFIKHDDKYLTIHDALVPKRTQSNPEKVPDPLFYHSSAHNQVLYELALSLARGEKSLLLIGNQGVGKNKLVDRLLQLLNIEREYIQLHRESTIQSLTVIPALENGKIVFKDSPLLKAAKEGICLVVDEADKAPVEIVTVLKALAEDGEVHLHDGRRLLSVERYEQEKFQVTGKRQLVESEVIVVHPNFLLCVLANRPGFPFLGNNLFRECGDVFSVHIIENLDLKSEIDLLKSYGPSVDVDIVMKLANSFAQLRQLNEQGDLQYPFSVREAVSIIKHVEKYPQDSIAAAIESVIAFDSLLPRTRSRIAAVFQKHGLFVPLTLNDCNALLNQGMPEEELRNAVFKPNARKYGLHSVPRTGLDSPKHGKEDRKNEPHVGGNTWAGGTGGSDTAGLGGRGGPYRLDKGHEVHQVSDEMKRQVSDAAKAEAKRIASEALAKRLSDISMGRSDYETYLRFKSRVAKEIDQLRNVFEELARRSTERVWLRNQSHGDLDDNRIVDGLTGERMIFKRRGYPADQHDKNHDMGGDKQVQKRLQFVVDVSASMYRFNGLDRRLERMLESVLMILEAMPSNGNKDSSNSSSALSTSTSLDYAIHGHCGDSASIKFVDFGPYKPQNENSRLEVLESMSAYTQYTQSGDNTLASIYKAVENVTKHSNGDTAIRYVFVISDANFNMYGITPKELSKAMSSDRRVAVHLILIASLGDEADVFARQIPSGRVHLCYQNTDMPALFRTILYSASGLMCE